MGITVERILEEKEFDLRLRLVAGAAGLQHEVRHTRMETPGLALAGEVSFVDTDRVQVMGGSELAYLASLSENRMAEVIRIFFSIQPACIVVVDDLPVPDLLKTEADAKGVPLLLTTHRFSTLADRLSEFLIEHLGESSSLHAVLVDVLGVGVLLLGKSGIGKSECALDLVVRGHRLVADDVVYFRKYPPAAIFGSCSSVFKHHMEIRGLGIINIKDLYGVSAVRDRKKVELVVELVDWEEMDESDRLGVEERRYNILGVELPYLIIPVRPGRNITTVIEVAARNLLLKRQGHHSAREFQEKLKQVIAGDTDQQAMGEEVE